MILRKVREILYVYHILAIVIWSWSIYVLGILPVSYSARNGRFIFYYCRTPFFNIKFRFALHRFVTLVGTEIADPSITTSLILYQNLNSDQFFFSTVKSIICKWDLLYTIQYFISWNPVVWHFLGSPSHWYQSPSGIIQGIWYSISTLSGMISKLWVSALVTRQSFQFSDHQQFRVDAVWQ